MSFDALAPHYRWMEFVLAGEKLQRCRTRFLGAVASPQRILLLGEGHGRCLTECCRRFPHAQITCADASANMLAQAERRLKGSGRGGAQVQFIHADVLDWKPPPRSFDLVITNFFFDCFRADQVARIVSSIAAVTAPHADWLVADFQMPSSGLKRVRAQVILWMMYAFFRMATQLPAKRLTTPDCSLRCAGFTLHRRIDAEWGLLCSDWWRRAPAGEEGSHGNALREISSGKCASEAYALDV
ncbi:MAG: class I SAM-dependent methyltransferase [Verrucomicrobiales bacterium]|nr:class I SAM-dependent methyltransferase [Verrucomicrobiales bacterium]